jgi:hypothetical protein
LRFSISSGLRSATKSAWGRWRWEQLLRRAAKKRSWRVTRTFFIRILIKDLRALHGPSLSGLIGAGGGHFKNFDCSKVGKNRVRNAAYLVDIKKLTF